MRRTAVLETARTVYRSLPSGFQRRVLVARRTPLWLDSGIVFIHIPKAAGTAVNEALYGRFMGHVRASDVVRWGSPELRALPRFAIARNPWDRLVSAYRFVKRGGGIGGPNAGRVRRPGQYRVPEFATFDRFVREWLPGRVLSKLDPVFHPQSLYVCSVDGDLLVDHLGRYENLEATFEYLRQTLPSVGHFAESNRSGAPVDYRTFYTAELRELVASIYADDVRNFRYAFD